MKSLIFIFIISLSLFGETKIEGFKQFKLGMTLSELRALDIIKNVNYLNPLCMVSTKSHQTLASVDIGNFMIMSFHKGRVKTITIHNIDVTNFYTIKNALEKRFDKNFVYIKSKYPQKICSYYSLKTKKEATKKVTKTKTETKKVTEEVKK